LEIVAAADQSDERDEIARRTAQDWRAYDGMAFAHFEQLKTMLDKKDPSYRE
jgi:hypothetical protein